MINKFWRPNRAGAGIGYDGAGGLAMRRDGDTGEYVIIFPAVAGYIVGEGATDAAAVADWLEDAAYTLEELTAAKNKIEAALDALRRAYPEAANG